ncbi:translation initiation factor eIF5 [Starmerella bacillaris]|uniref:Translation initiation factor eIF5 n=1 Tax=Starmerella bacillaris TaxID=1247836 RepID=A0AAV5RMP3_STABA|nr:translation initiation factor eIF5 [Starmerella bacillaris]
MSINIRRDNADPFYRYKMAPIQSKTEGRGNGVKTFVVNTGEVARNLNRPPSYIIKYFGFELGAQTSINEEAERYLVNGIHASDKLQDTLDGFINKFVLCGSCLNPETDFIIHKNGTVEKDCKACGAKTLVDPQHKLTGFILKNPPATIKSKKKGMANAGASTTAVAEDDETAMDEQDSSDLTKKINAEAAVLPAMKESNDEDVQWSADVSEEAVKARLRQADRTMAALSLHDGANDTTPEETYSEFGEWVIETRPSDVEIYKRMNELKIQQNIKTVQVLAQVLFTEDIVKEIPDHNGILSKVVTSPAHEKALLGGIERFIGLQHPELIKEVPNVLFKLYDADLVSEDVVERWGTKASKRYVPKDVSKKVRRAAKPFIDWLEEAESESESESE